MHLSNFALAGLVPFVIAKTWQVTVGANNALTFIPSVINAQSGDKVQFNFVSQNHTATSGDMSQGCAPNGRFNSGFVPIPTPAAAVANANTAAAKKGKKAKKAKNNAAGKTGKKAKTAAAAAPAAAAPIPGTPPSFTVDIQDTNPVAVYCAQQVHCQMGMVMIINPSNDADGMTLARYQQMSIAAGANIIPDGGPTGGTLANLAPPPNGN